MSGDRRLVVVVPGIGGSVLRSGTRETLWDAGPASALRLLRDPGRLDLGREVVPCGLIRDRVLFPGFSKIHGYRRLLERVARVAGSEIDEGDPDRPRPTAHVVAFPYDFRRGVVAAAARLDALVHDRLHHLGLAGRPDRVVIVAHSLGGLVARYWVAQGNWRICRGVITLGTPHLGAPKALEYLVNGPLAGLGGCPSLRAQLRRWPSMYELLPQYRSVLDRSPGRSDRAARSPDKPAEQALYPDELPIDWLRSAARQATGVHEEIDRRWHLHRAEVGVHPYVGRGHRTLSHAVWDGARLRSSKRSASWLGRPDGEKGDSTVPEFAAVPAEQQAELRRHYLSTTHTTMVADRGSLGMLAELLTDIPPAMPSRWDDVRSVVDTMVGLDLDDAYPAGAPFTVAAELDPPGREAPGMSLAFHLRGPTGDLRGRLEPHGDAWRAAVPGLPPGRYELRVSAEPADQYPRLTVSEWFEVIDDAG